ncbi:MAG: LamB/YcsF family protein [Alphaproteobacteria bacterium]|nr:LamB/YcsF family protein [Alphaproteobacteria bacterium]
MQHAMDVNSDVGESFGNYAFGADAEIMPHLSSANVACGFHAGDPVHMERTVQLAKQHGVAVGVHWGLPDIAGFGRREINISTDEARCLTLYQIGALRQIADSVGATIDHLVPHGALYPMLAKNDAIAGAMIDAINRVDAGWVLYWPTPLERHRFYEIARAEGIRIVHELCIDLEYRCDGSLIVERQKRRVDPGRVADRLERFIRDRKLRTVDDTDLEFDAQAILVHGDGPNAADVVRAVRQTLERLQVSVRPASTLVGAPRQ